MRTITVSFQVAALSGLLSTLPALATDSLLQVGLVGPASVQLNWTNPPPNAILESVDELSDCLLWEAVPATPVFSNGQFSVTLPVSGTSRLFHLYPLPTQNLPPVWCPLPDQTVVEAATLEVPLHALSPNRKPVTYGTVTELANATLDGAGVFRFTPVTSQLGENLFAFFATDGTLSSTQQLRVVVVPIPVFEHRNADGSFTLSWSSAVPGFELQQSDTIGAGAVWTTVPGTPLLVGASFQITLPPSDIEHFFRLKLIPLPPDPATLASPLAPNTFNDLGSSTAFLYTGPNPIQTGVTPGTIAPMRAAVVRGKVTRRDKSPLPAVRVTVVNHPEYGSTLTRADGMFDLAVNGGLYTLDFQANGYCEAQRQVQAPFQDFRTVPDVALVPLDPVATPVTFGSNAPPQMAAGSPQTDGEGTRTTRVFLPAGTTATLVMPDGSTRSASGLTLRMTEFTVGPNGPAAMPAALPPTSAYTFCAEFSADEAMGLGAKTIQFNRPVWGYVENFRNAPVGMLVPNAYYDRGQAGCGDQAGWVPSANGIVLKILGVTDGLAQVDLRGSNVVADASTLAGAAFTTTELQQLAATYSPGQSLLRVPLSHFSSWDWNWANVLNFVKTNRVGDKPLPDPKDNSKNNFGNVNFTTRVFQEGIPLVGAPMALHYSSARVPDYRVNAQTVVPVLAWPPPTNVLGAELQYEVAGKYTDRELGLVPTATISWDGYDAYGRYVGGTRMASGRVILEMPPLYSGFTLNYFQDLVTSQPLFAAYGQTTFVGGHAQNAFAVAAPFSQLLTIPDHRALGLGGWSLTPHHSYDPVGQLLYLGDGTVLRQDRFANGINGVPGLTGVPHYQHALNVAAGADGTLFSWANFDDSYYPRFCKLDPQGQFSYLSGNTVDANVISVDYAGYGQVDCRSALLAAFGSVTDMTVGPDGSLYFRNKYTIGRIDPQGILHKVLGDGGPWPYPYPPDGTLASHAMTQPTSTGCLAVGPDGTVYYDDFWNIGCLPGNYICGTNFIRKVAPDGRIYTVMGQAGTLWTGGFFDPTNDWRGQIGKKASEALLTPIRALAAGPDGTLYVAPNAGYAQQYFVGGIYKIGPDGTLGMVMNRTPIANVGWEYLPGQGDDGTNAATFTSYFGNAYSPDCLRASADGSVTFSQSYGSWYGLYGDVAVVWRITPDGFLQRLAGRGPYTAVSTPYPSQVGANPLQVVFGNGGYKLALGSDGSLTMVGADDIPYRLSAAALSFTGKELQIPAQDASEVYIFDANGLHLRTLDGLTGWTNWTFTYDASSQITDLRDANGLVTHIERDGAGNPAAIVGPYGQRSTLGLDANGFLHAVVNPAGETTTVSYSKGGLLTSFTGPLLDTYTVAYDINGLVAQVRDPLGGGYDITSTNLGTWIRIASSTTLGSVDTRTLVLQPNGDTSIATGNPDGTSNTTVLALSGASSVSSSDGTLANYATVVDPRFPQASWLTASASVGLPGGPTDTFTMSPSATLSDASNPFSVATLSNSATLNGRQYTLTYNGTNRLSTLTSPEGRRQVLGVDAQGRSVHSQAPGRSTIDLVYDTQGRLAEVDDTASIGRRRTTLSYDSLGRLSLVTDPLGRTNQFTYDSASRLAQTVMFDGQTAAFRIDAESRLASATPPGHPAHQFQRNAVGLLTNYVPPVVDGLDESVHYAYDADRHLIQVNLPDGQKVVFTSGLGGRIQQLALGSDATLTYTYASSNGLPTDIASTTGSGLHFDYQGPVATNTAWSGSITGSVSLTLNADLLPASQSVNGASIAYGYDRDLLLTNAGGLTVTRDPATGFVMGTGLGSVTDQRRYDNRGLLTNYVASINGTPVWSLALSYDALDRVTNRVETGSGVTRTFGYVYDVRGRLKEVWQDGGLATTYTYDATGNRLGRNAETATYDAQDRILTYAGDSFGWSLNGTLRTHTAAGQTTSYTYNAGGALTAVAPGGGQPVEYLLDPVGRRIGKNVGGTLERGWLWDETRPIAELHSDSTVALRFVYATAAATPSFLTMGTNVYRLLSDERGSVRLVVNAADGSVAQELDYDEFGRVVKDTAPGFQPFGYAGGLYDPDTGLVHFGARDYSAQIGRWLSRDPAWQGLGVSSLYAYCGADPINQTDVDGMDGVVLGPWALIKYVINPDPLWTPPGVPLNYTDAFRNSLQRLASRTLTTTGNQTAAQFQFNNAWRYRGFRPPGGGGSTGGFVNPGVLAEVFTTVGAVASAATAVLVAGHEIKEAGRGRPGWIDVAQEYWGLTSYYQLYTGKPASPWGR